LNGIGQQVLWSIYADSLYLKKLEANKVESDILFILKI